MKVQEIDTKRGRRWIVLDDAYAPIGEANAFLRFMDNTGRSENTLRTYAYALKLYCEFLSLRGMGILEIGSDSEDKPLDILADFLVWLQNPDIVSSKRVLLMRSWQKRSPKTVNTILGVVLSMYDYLGRNHIVDPFSAYRERIDMRKFKPFLFEMIRKRRIIRTSLLHIPEPRNEIEFVDTELFKRMIDACSLWRDKAIIAIMFDGGLRLGETLGLHTSDIEVWNNKINIVSRPNNANHCQVKNKAEGSVYISNRAVEYLAAYYTSERPDYSCDFVFVNLFGTNIGKPMMPDTVEKLFDRISKTLGVRIHPHMCRHGCATMRLEAGWDEPSIQKQLRHVNISTTRIYEHYKDSLLLEKTRDLMMKQQERFGWKDDEE